MFLVLARLFLIVDSLIFAMVGVFLFTDPTSLEYFNIDSAAGITAVRTWGGLFFGVGIVGLISSVAREWITQGLVVLLITGSMIILARLYGITADGMEPRQVSELRDEALGPVLAIIGLVFCLIHQRRSNK